MWLAGLLCSGVALAQVGMPQVKLCSVDVYGRPFDLRSLHGQVVAITFASRYTSGEAARVHRALAPRAQAGELRLISVVDFVGIPSFAYGYARRKIAEHEQAGPIHYLIDERGAFRGALDVRPDQRVDILLIDRDGSLVGHFLGAQQVPAALRAIDQLQLRRPRESAPTS